MKWYRSRGVELSDGSDFDPDGGGQGTLLLDATAARLMGIRTNRIMMFTWGISSVVGSVAGLLIAPVIMQPYMMWDPLLKGFAAAVMGGMTSLPGAVCGAYLLGIIENLFGGYVSIEFKAVVAFVIIVLMNIQNDSQGKNFHF